MLALAVNDDQPYFLTDVEVLERSIHDAVPVEVELVALGDQNEALAFFAGQPHDCAVDRHLMRLYTAVVLRT